MKWLPYFRKEFEKDGFLNLAMNAAMGLSSIGDIKRTQNENKLQPLMQNEQSMQLPSTNNIQFPGSKRMDPYANTATQRY